MNSALSALKLFSLNLTRISVQAAIHFHLPYSSLYGRINRLKREATVEWAAFRDLPDYNMEQDMEEGDHSNGIDYRLVSMGVMTVGNPKLFAFCIGICLGNTV